MGELFPLLVRALHEKEIVPMQFLQGGHVRVTVHSEAYREELSSSVSSVLKISLFLLRLLIVLRSSSMSVICPMK